MTDAFWYADKGASRGPITAADINGLISKGAIRPDTLMWADGMAEWARADRVERFASRFFGGPPPMIAAMPAAGELAGGGPDAGLIRSELPTWGLFGRGLLYMLAFIVVIPVPWVAPAIYRWGAEHIRLPNGKALRFDGDGARVWPLLVAPPILFWLGQINQVAQFFTIIATWVVTVYILRWFCSNLRAQDGSLNVRFAGGFFAYIGWQLLTVFSIFTIIGWAWVLKFLMRWLCRNVVGTKTFSFEGTGLAILWRTFAVAFASMLIIPIPWVMSWYANWFFGQVRVESKASA